jgi:hypothetical protein
MKDDDFTDSLILLIEDAEKAGIPYERMLSDLQEAIEDVQGRQARKAIHFN